LTIELSVTLEGCGKSDEEKKERENSVAPSMS
jgi:hypothetical protein